MKKSTKTQAAKRTVACARKRKTSLSRLGRMLRIHAQLAEARKAGALPPTLGEIGKKFGISNKTLRRDIAYMRDQLKLPITYDPDKRRHGYTREVAGLPLRKITGRDLLLWRNRVLEAIQHCKGTPDERRLRRGIHRICMAFSQ